MIMGNFLIQIMNLIESFAAKEGPEEGTPWGRPLPFESIVLPVRVQEAAANSAILKDQSWRQNTSKAIEEWWLVRKIH